MRFLWIIFILVSCSKAIEPLEPQPIEQLPPTMFIESLNEGSIMAETVVQGSVTTSDSCGNFYQSLYIEDPTGALELRFSFYDVHSLFKIGEVVSVKLHDRRLTLENGQLYANMGSFALASKSVIGQGRIDPINPKRLSINDIDASKIGRYIELAGGTFDKAGIQTWAGEQKFTIGKSSIQVYTSSYAAYATELLPTGKLTLRGVVTMYRGVYQLKLSSPSDCISE